MSNVRNLTGSIVAIVTPFKENGDVDFESLDRLVDFHLANGTDGILVLGTTGESSTMTDAEDVAVAQHVVNRVNGAIPIIGGAGSNATHESLAKAKSLQMIGVDALLLITPYYNKSNEEGIYRHFLDVLDATEIPSIPYNIPGRTGCSISYATTVAQYLSDDFRMYSGNDDMVVPILSLGGSGVISVWANIRPQQVHDMVDKYLNHDYQGALKIQLDELELIHALFCEVNPIPVKAALAKMGLITESYRQPLWPMADASRERLYNAMRGVGLID